MEIAAFILSVIAGVIGFFFLSEATLGVGILAVAALLGIWARLFQADKHHKKEYARLGAIQNNIAHLQKKAKPSQSLCQSEPYRLSETTWTNAVQNRFTRIPVY